MKEIFYSESFYPDLEEMHSHLLGLDWLTKRTARHEYFMSLESREYSYGNRQTGDEVYHSKDFTKEVMCMMGMVNFAIGAKFNVCFLNKYDNEQQHLGWHADDFEGMNPDAPIAVVSFGAEREIWWKPKDQKGVIPEDQKQLLADGSLWVMPIGFQDTHFHKIPKHSQPCDWRVSLTFREFL